MARTDDATMEEIRRLLDEYRRVIYDSSLRPKTKDSYLDRAGYFVRWVAEEYQPGEMNR